VDADDIAEFLETLAQRLTPTANHVVELVQRQLLIEAILGAIVLGIALIAILILWLLTIRSYRGRGRNADTMFIVSAFVSGTTAFIMLFCIPEIATRIFNPEWAVIQYLLNQVGG